MEKVQIFQDKKVRTHWDAEKEEWYFSVVDVVRVLTDSANPTDYLKKMRKRDSELATFMGTNCPQVDMMTETGKRRKTLAADSKAVFRIIQSIASPKAEPFKQWMAQVGAETRTGGIAQRDRQGCAGEEDAPLRRSTHRHSDARPRNIRDGVIIRNQLPHRQNQTYNKTSKKKRRQMTVLEEVGNKKLLK